MLERLQRELVLLSRFDMAGRRGRLSKLLDRSAFLLLFRLHVQGAMTIGQLAEAYNLDTSTVNRQTAALLRQGLARRVADPDGGLARKLQITEDGRRRLAADQELCGRGLALVLREWTPQEVELLEEVLTRLNRSIESCEGRSWPRPEMEPAVLGGPAGESQADADLDSPTSHPTESGWPAMSA
jgi:DNA-binding MarR family transcriptional regulator